MWEISKTYGTINDGDLSKFTFYAPDETLPFSSNLLSDKEILGLYKYAFRSFYLRPKFILRQLAKLRSFNDIYRNWLAAKGVIGM